MSKKLPHAKWLEKLDLDIRVADGRRVLIYELVVNKVEQETLRAWAKHFREHYCLDNKIDRYRKNTGKSRVEYLLDHVFPDAKDDFGPATRSGDFAEIMIADLLEIRMGYWVPRVRYLSKMIRNESPKGTDVVGFKFEQGGPESPSEKDILIAVEAKAQLTGKHPKARLQDAVNDSMKDKLRIGESLNAIKRRLIDLDRDDEADRVGRFQEGINVPFVRRSGAAAIVCSGLYDEKSIVQTDCSKHENQAGLRLIVVRSKSFMKLVHYLYEKAANEAK